MCGGAIDWLRWGQCPAASTVSKTALPLYAVGFPGTLYTSHLFYPKFLQNALQNVEIEVIDYELSTIGIDVNTATEARRDFLLQASNVRILCFPCFFGSRCRGGTRRYPAN